MIGAKSPLRSFGGGLATIPFGEIFLLFLHLLVAELNNYRVVDCKTVVVHIALVALCPDANIRLRIVDVENLIYNLTLLHA